MTDDLLWYCVRTKPKTEKRTAALLRTEVGIDVFCPLVRFERARRSGRLWVTEAMFPGYLFARFCFVSQHRMLRATHGVTKVIGFSGEASVVPERVIAELREAVKDDETVVIETGVEVGEEVNMVAGPFRGVRALVTRVIPARQRVMVLLEVLGMEREVEVATHAILPDTTHPLVRANRKSG